MAVGVKSSTIDVAFEVEKSKGARVGLFEGDILPEGVLIRAATGVPDYYTSTSRL